MGRDLVRMFDMFGGAGETRAPCAREMSRRVPTADLAAVAEVRRLVREVLRRWGVPGFVDTAELLASELVTNALVHTDDDALFVVRLSGGGPADHRLRVEVHDRAARRPQPRDPEQHSTSGRGLMLVRSLSDAWGVRPQGPGKAVWFELQGAAAG
jgi:anti-sigma regulatory factor (Ser/Thr protein kinase)